MFCVQNRWPLQAVPFPIRMVVSTGIEPILPWSSAKRSTYWATKPWRRTQDSNLQAVARPEFSRLLPHHPDIRLFLAVHRGIEPLSHDRQSSILTIIRMHHWLQGQDLNLRPSGNEPDELPNCSTPRYWIGTPWRSRTFDITLIWKSTWLIFNVLLSTDCNVEGACSFLWAKDVYGGKQSNRNSWVSYPHNA